jgi:DNA polymerase I-like protein with 3'-5' exonuclease and polymerase domains
LPGAADLYGRAKTGVFAFAYGGQESTLADKTGATLEAIKDAIDKMFSKYQAWLAARQAIEAKFCTMAQAGGLGSRIEWTDPEDYIESMTGFRRYFTLENKVAKALYELANDPPNHWREAKVKVQRSLKGREQQAHGAARSAVYGAAFGLQANNFRAAANHLIQSSGATLTKGLQVKVWAHQPTGIHEFIVLPLQIHDEIMCPVKHGYEDAVAKTVNDEVARITELVPLCRMKWVIGMKSWAEK